MIEEPEDATIGTDENGEEGHPGTAREGDDRRGARSAGAHDDDARDDDARDDDSAAADVPAEDRWAVDNARAEARASAAEKRADDLREQVLRSAADFDNLRKRLERERVEERKHAATSLVRQLLPVADSLHRALEQAQSAKEEAPGFSAFVDGLCLIESQFFDILKASGLQVIEAKGQAFDPALHEALLQEASNAEHMTVLDVLETGYLFNGRLLRPARVKVAFNPEGRDAESAKDVERGGSDGSDQDGAGRDTGGSEGEAREGDSPESD